jgi:TonB family protein
MLNSKITNWLTICLLTTLLIWSQTTRAKEASDFSQAYQAYLSAVESGTKSEILAHAKNAYELGQGRFGDAHEDTLALRYNLALAHSGMYEGEAANSHFAAIKAGYVELHGADSLPVLAVVLEQMNNLKQYPAKQQHSTSHKKFARQLIKEAEDLLTKQSQLTPAELLDIRYQYARTMATLDVPVNIFRKTLNILKDTHAELLDAVGKNDIRSVELGFLLGKYYHIMEKDSKAIAYMHDVLSVFDEYTEVSHPYELAAHAQLVKLLEKQGESEAATEHCIAIGKMTPWSTDTDPIPLYRELPRFPSNMARLGKEGTVVIEFRISETGFVVEPQVVSSTNDEFADVALAAVSAYRYAPKVINNEAVLSETKRIQMDFTL